MAVPGEVIDATRVTEERTTVGEVDVYVAASAAPGPHPGVIVVHEAFGRVPHIEDVTRRFANAGYVAAAPELYSRTGRPAMDRDSIFGAMFGLPDEQIVADCEAVAAHLRARSDGSGRVGIIGFCMGGRATELVAFSSSAVDAAVGCWGGFVDRADAEHASTGTRPTPVVELADGLSCPLLVVGGTQDENPSPDVLRDLHGRLVGAGKDVTLSLYEGAGHAFFADYRDSYVEDAAFRLWDEVMAFFARHLRA